MANPIEATTVVKLNQARLTRRAALQASAGLLSLLLAGCTAIGQDGQDDSGKGAESENDATQPVSDLPPAPKRDHPAPDFTLTRLDGGAITLSELRGAPVILNFWASWCGPCRLEMPHLQESSTEHRDNLVILGVNLTQRENDRAEISAFVDEFDLTFPIVLDEEGTAAKLYNVRGQPASVFINAEGIVQTVFYGPVTKDFIEERILEISNS